MADLKIFLLCIGVLVLMGAVVLVIGAILERRRRRAYAAFAATEGWTYLPDQDREYARGLSFLNLLNHGENRYLSHRFRGSYGGLEFDAFEYHYQTTSGSGKDRRTTHHHFTVVLTPLPRACPELILSREGFFDRVAAFFGFEDIDFESAEFSKTFHVRSKDKKFAYAVIHPLMMEWLLRRTDVTVEIEGSTLAVMQSGCLELERLHPLLGHLGGIRRHLPSHLFDPPPSFPPNASP